LKENSKFELIILNNNKLENIIMKFAVDDLNTIINDSVNIIKLV